MQLAAGLPGMLRAPSPHAPAGEQLQADRSTYVAVPKSLQPHFPLTVRWMLRVQAAADVGYRAFFPRVRHDGAHARDHGAHTMEARPLLGSHWRGSDRHHGQRVLCLIMDCQVVMYELELSLGV
jgi:hypothetical protein